MRKDDEFHKNNKNIGDKKHTSQILQPILTKESKSAIISGTRFFSKYRICR